MRKKQHESRGSSCCVRVISSQYTTTHKILIFAILHHPSPVRRSLNSFLSRSPSLLFSFLRTGCDFVCSRVDNLTLSLLPDKVYWLDCSGNNPTYKTPPHLTRPLPTNDCPRTPTHTHTQTSLFISFTSSPFASFARLTQHDQHHPIATAATITNTHPFHPSLGVLPLIFFHSFPGSFTSLNLSYIHQIYQIPSIGNYR